MYKCKICNKEFLLDKAIHYISRDNGKIGLSSAFGSEPEVKHYDTFDCPYCGCQNIMQERKRNFTELKMDEEV